MPTRRTLIQLIGAGMIVPRLAIAQTARKVLVVVLFPGDSDEDARHAQPFFDEMHKLGWTEGVNITYEKLSGRGAREYVEGLAKIAADLEPQLIYATTGTLALGAIKATETIPVVFMTAADPVATKLVASFKRPGRNATGMYSFRSDSVARCFQLIRDTFPDQARVGAVFDRRGAEYTVQRALHQEAATHTGLELSAVDFTNFEAVPKIFANFRREGIRTVLVTPSFTLVANRLEVGKHAMRNQLALVAYRADWTAAGALLTYGAEVAESLRRSAALANRILKGEKPAETPVERATKFELVINRVSAKALGVTVPKAVLARANHIIG